MIIRQKFNKWKLARAEKKSAEACVAVFHDEPATTDTVVFVHGLGGHYRNTWKQFPNLLHLDIDLPRFDILLWGYDSSAWRPSVLGVSTEAKRLMSDMRLLLRRAESIFLVGHSMGGLTILEGLVDELKENRAFDLPINVVQHVILYATPTNGNEAASVVKLTVGIFPLLKFLVNRQIKNLSAGDFCQELVREVNTRIYSPNIQCGEQSSKREIPITACIGTRDRCVKEASARAIFARIPPTLLDHDHRSIKEPESRKDRRYLALKNILEKHYTRWFHEQAILSLSNTNGECKSAAKVLLARCAHSLHERLMAHARLGYSSKNKKEQRELQLEYLRIAVEFAGNMARCQTAEILNAAFTEMYTSFEQ